MVGRPRLPTAGERRLARTAFLAAILFPGALLLPLCALPPLCWQRPARPPFLASSGGRIERASRLARLLARQAQSQETPQDGDGAFLGQLLGPTAAELLPLLDAERLRRRNAARPRRIILVRHGESVGNVDRAAYESTPDSQIALTRLGHLQGEALGKQIRHLVGDGLVRFAYSPYMRTRQTLNAILTAFEGQSVELSAEPRLREQDFGNFQNVETMRDAYKERQKFGRYYYRFPNGEAGTDVYDRVCDLWGTLTGVMDDPRQPLDNIVLVTHGLLMRVFCMVYFHWTVQEFEQVWNPSNCEAWVLAKKPATGRYELEGRWVPSPKGGNFREVRFGAEKNQPLWDHMKRRYDTRTMVPGSKESKTDPLFRHLQVPAKPDPLRHGCRQQSAP